jgi:hypothetical protein
MIAALTGLSYSSFEESGNPSGRRTWRILLFWVKQEITGYKVLLSGGLLAYSTGGFQGAIILAFTCSQVYTGIPG